MIICGVMTGTSLDGIDVAICDFFLKNNEFKFDLIYFEHLDFSTVIKNKLRQVIEKGVIDLKTLSQLNFAYSEEIATAIEKVLHNNKSLAIDAIGFHGQTLWHNPTTEEFCGRKIASTYQLGSGTYLSARLKKKVVYDFRTADMVVGGEGAPLVTVFDYYFLKSKDKNVIALNIGGISNITYLKKNCKIDEVVAFDCGPGNCLIDICAKRFFGVDYDYNGEFARQGKIIEEMLNELKTIEFIYKSPPKSTGRELFNEKLVEKYLSSYHSYDVIRTVTEYTAFSIAYNIKNFADNRAKVIVSGGGAKNKFLMECLKNHLQEARFQLSDEIGIPVDVKEAIAFAFLAYCRLNGVPANVPNATGAKKAVLLGAIAENY